MRVGWLLLALIVAIVVLLGGAMLWFGAPPASVVPHPEFATLLRAGAQQDARALIAVGWGFGALQVAFFGACFALGMRRPDGLGGLRRPIALGIAGYQLVWMLLVLAYWRFASQTDAELVLSFPLPTAVMLYAMWPFPLLFMFLYLRHFERRVLSDEDLARFRARIAALRAERPER